MSNNFIGAKELSQKKKDEHEDVEHELFIVPMEKINNDGIDIKEGDITQDSDTQYSMSLIASDSKQELSDEIKKNKKTSIINKVQTFLDIAGFVPLLGAVPDVANGIIYLCRGDYVNMGMSFVAAIPGYGDAAAGVAKGIKYGAKATKYVKTSKLARIESNQVSKQAKFIIGMAKGQQTKNVSLLWTNGTKKNAQKVIEEVQRMAPELNIRMLETTSRGIRLENTTRAKLVKFARRKGMPYEQIKKELENGTLWNTLEKYPDFFFGKKIEIEKIQKSVSKEYAKESTGDVIVEFYDKSMGQFKNSQRSFIPGKINKEEINLLRKMRKNQGKRSVDGIIGVDPIR